MIFGRRHAKDETAQTTAPEPTPARTVLPGAPSPDATAGLRLTEKSLLPIFGPAQVGDSTAPLRPASEAERSRDRALRTTLTRVVGKDGKSYVVAVPDEARSPEADPPDETVRPDPA